MITRGQNVKNISHNDWDPDDIVAALALPTSPLPVPRLVPAPKRRHGQWRLGNSLAMCRVVRGLTQAQLAAAVGVSRRTISGIENRKHEPVVSLALAIAEALDSPVEQLFSLHRH